MIRKRFVEPEIEAGDVPPPDTPGVLSCGHPQGLPPAAVNEIPEGAGRAEAGDLFREGNTGRDE